MRRALSVTLFILGAWLLCTEVLMAWIDVGQGAATELGMIAIMSAFCAPFLLLGTWASPGNRLADLGVTMMTAAIVGGTLAVFIFVLLSDPNFVKYLAPDSRATNFRIAPVSGLLNLLVVGGGGWFLYRFVLRRSAPGAASAQAPVR
jgi:hypothetical protein